MPPLPPLPTAGSTDTQAPEAGSRRYLPKVTAQRYEPGAVLARGGQGRVRRGSDSWLGREVAIKEPVSSIGGSRLLREALITARLQHPAIVPVYDAGRDGNGVPFCAMKLVDGKSLHAVIAETRGFDERLGLLPRVLAVAEAIAYAHSRGVLHRDLKPANVLVGAYGETVVIDWGLAKALDDVEAPEEVDVDAATPTEGGDAAPQPATPGADTNTAAGTVLGTPSYMAPEQARGERVDARADVYALGAMLYHLLAGVPPYRVASAASGVGRNVLEGPPAPLTSLVRGLPRDLATIVAKAMARTPAERYASAAELAAELGRFTRGQLVAAHRYGIAARIRRFARRQRAAVAVAIAAFALLGLTVLDSMRRVVAERDVAQVERSRAVTQRHAAEELVDFMLGEQRTSLAALGKLDLMEGVGKRVAGYYDALRAQGLDREGRRRRIEALSALGDIALARDRLDEAVGFLGAAVADDRLLLAARSPDRKADMLQLVSLHVALADVARERGDARAALVEASNALGLLVPLLSSESGDPRLQYELAQIHSRRGDALQRDGNASAALAAYRQSLAIIERLPPGVADETALDSARYRVADKEMDTGASAHAVELYRAVAASAARRAAAAPEDMAAQAALAMSGLKLGEAAFASADYAGAKAAYVEARQTAEVLVAHEPENLQWQYLRWGASHRLGFAAATEGDDAVARAAFTEAVAIARDIVAKEPDASKWLHSLAQAESGLGQIEMLAKDYQAARRAYEAQADAARRASEAQPKNSYYRVDLSESQLNLAYVATATGHPAAAGPHYRAAVAIMEEVVSDDPDNVPVRHNLSLAYHAFADGLLQSGDVAGAVAAARKSVEHAERIAAADPARAAFGVRTALARGMLGDCLVRQGALAEARRLYDLTIAELERLDGAGQLGSGDKQNLLHYVDARAALVAADRRPAARGRP